jgi:hypothetical protein
MAKHTQHKALKPKKTQHKRFLEVYWPYAPLFLLIMAGLVFGVWHQPQKISRVSTDRAVLSYATDVSPGGLLAGTNAERSANGLTPLSMNWTLSSAAQSKASHMINNNYWAHTAPDGTTPWYFISNAGYSYQNAGENLAYGFLSSSEAITGWMNSPGHRANILGAYTEVGFGFANGSDYNSSGEQTVIVAMYGTPYAEPTPAPDPVPAPTPVPTVQSFTAPVPTRTVQAAPAQNLELAPTAEPSAVPIAAAAPSATTTPIAVAAPVTIQNTINKQVRISRIQGLTKGKAPWSIYAVSIGITVIVAAWILKHLSIIRKAFITGEDFVMHHPVLDIGIALLVALAVYLSRTTGIVL